MIPIMAMTAARRTKRTLPAFKRPLTTNLTQYLPNELMVQSSTRETPLPIDIDPPILQAAQLITFFRFGYYAALLLPPIQLHE